MYLVRISFSVAIVCMTYDPVSNDTDDSFNSTKGYFMNSTYTLDEPSSGLCADIEESRNEVKLP